MVAIIFEAHATSKDNEKQIASGWYDVQLSELGKQQAKELGERYRNKHIDAVFCSDLGRSLQTAATAFGGDPLFADPNIIRIDWRLRECNYGDLTRRSSDEVEREKANRISQPFPGGESYEDCAQRMKHFLNDLLTFMDGKTVLIIGHRATKYGLEHWINGIPLKEAVTAPWQWQPGWAYELRGLK